MCRGLTATDFPEVAGKVALVGGGIGVAPLYLAAKTLKAQGNPVDLYLGFTDEALLQDQYEAVCDHLQVNIGGYVTDDIDPAQYDVVMTCGPHIMMKIFSRKNKTYFHGVVCVHGKPHGLRCGRLSGMQLQNR